MTQLSSLAQQLRVIQQQDHVIGGVSTVNRGYVPSFLFEEREAADIDSASILAIGRQGLEELKALDPVFSKFEASLFGERTIDLHRSQISQAQNDQLDANIRSFLRVLSPFFMTKAAHKALEWLVRKFRIQELNLDALMECILPYHETVQFTRMVQIVFFKDESRWSFLHAVKKEAHSVSRSFLAKRCIADRTIIDSVFTTVEWMLQKHRDNGYRKPTTYLSFFTMLVLDYLQTLAKVELSHVLQLYPMALRFAKLKRVPEALQASFLIIMQLAQRYPILSADSVNQFFDFACRGCSEAQVPQLVLTLARVVDLCWASVTELDMKVVNHLVKLPGFSVVSRNLIEEHGFAHFPIVLEKSLRVYERSFSGDA